MRFAPWLRHQLMQLLFHEKSLALKSGPFALAPHFQDIERLGLYLHIPFCRQICPYCPYNKELFGAAMAQRYAQAVCQEVAHYSELVGNRPVTSFYIGGGTPTTMLHTGLAPMLEMIDRTFNRQCTIHMESHPNDLSAENLDTIADLGVAHLSIGVEALQDHHLRTLCRPYSAATAKAAIARAVEKGFVSVNVDLIFALPGQTEAELQEEAQTLIDLGVDQVATYPLFSFSYTQWPQLAQRHHYPGYSLLQKRRMLRVLEETFYAAGYERTSVWAFTKVGVPKYCSVTVPLYLGLGASGASYLRDIFYLNTFNVGEYVRTLEAGRLPIALSLELSTLMQMAGWLYWRVYETRFQPSDFDQRFHINFDTVYGKYMQPLSWLGLLHRHDDEIVLTNAGTYWLHALQDLFSIDYVSALWGTSQVTPWPAQVML